MIGGFGFTSPSQEHMGMLSETATACTYPNHTCQLINVKVYW